MTNHTKERIKFFKSAIKNITKHKESNLNYKLGLETTIARHIADSDSSNIALTIIHLNDIRIESKACA